MVIPNTTWRQVLFYMQSHWINKCYICGRAYFLLQTNSWPLSSASGLHNRKEAGGEDKLRKLLKARGCSFEKEYFPLSTCSRRKLGEQYVSKAFRVTSEQQAHLVEQTGKTPTRQTAVLGSSPSSPWYQSLGQATLCHLSNEFGKGYHLRFFPLWLKILPL